MIIAFPTHHFLCPVCHTRQLAANALRITCCACGFAGNKEHFSAIERKAA